MNLLRNDVFPLIKPWKLAAASLMLTSVVSADAGDDLEGCGDGVIQPGEVCDDANNAGNNEDYDDGYGGGCNNGCGAGGNNGGGRQQ